LTVEVQLFACLLDMYDMESLVILAKLAEIAACCPTWWIADIKFNSAEQLLHWVR